MTSPISWPETQRICDIPEVREALDKFAADAHEENMLAMVSAIMGHAFTQGRAAGLEEAARVVTDYDAARQIRALSPTPSDAGTDDALELDAKRHRWLRNESWAGYNQSKGKPQVFETVTMVLDGARNFKCILAEEALDDAVDAAIAAQGEGK